MDMGVVWFCTLSDGTQIAPCNALKKHLKKLAQLQRALSRKEKFSSNWKKAQQEIARLHQRIGNIRQDFINKVALDLSKKTRCDLSRRLENKEYDGKCGRNVEQPWSQCSAEIGFKPSDIASGLGKVFPTIAVEV